MDKIVEYYNKCGSLKETAAVFQIGWQKVRKILITEGVYTSEIAQKVQIMYKSGLDISTIAAKLKLSKSTVNSYMPYSKTQYNNPNPSKNAIYIRQWRKKNLGKQHE